MKQYLDTLQHILKNGIIRQDRTGTGTLSVFGVQNRYNLADGFPAVSTKKLNFNSVVAELLWFLEGSCDERRLCEIQYGTRNVERKTIWTANSQADYWKDKAKYPGDLGRIYSAQWRSWVKPDGSTLDQIQNVIDSIKNDPSSRRHLVVSYNPGEVEQMALPPCHSLFQFYVNTIEDTLSCQMYQRSSDEFLGKPFNIASYAILTHMIAQVCNLGVGELIITTGDTHLYLDHVPKAKLQLSREPYSLPSLWLNPDIKNIFDFTMDDIKLIDYKYHSKITAKMAV